MSGTEYHAAAAGGPVFEVFTSFYPDAAPHLEVTTSLVVGTRGRRTTIALRASNLPE